MEVANGNVGCGHMVLLGLSLFSSRPPPLSPAKVSSPLYILGIAPLLSPTEVAITSLHITRLPSLLSLLKSPLPSTYYASPLPSLYELLA